MACVETSGEKVDRPWCVKARRYATSQDVRRASKDAFRPGVISVDDIEHQRLLGPPLGTIVDDEVVVDESFPARAYSGPPLAPLAFGVSDDRRDCDWNCD